MKHLSFSPIPQRSARVLSSSQRSHFDFLPFSTIFISSESSNPWQKFKFIHHSRIMKLSWWQQMKLFQYLPRWATIDPLLDSGKVSFELIFGWFTFRTNDPIKFWRFLDAFYGVSVPIFFIVCLTTTGKTSRSMAGGQSLVAGGQSTCRRSILAEVHQTPSLFLILIIIIILTKCINRISAMTGIILKNWIGHHSSYVISSILSSISKLDRLPSQLPHS